MCLQNFYLFFFFFSNCINRFICSGQSEELTDEDYNTSYDDYGNSNESSKEISPVTDAIDTLSIVHSTETLTSHNTNQESELTTLSTIDLTVSTEAATKIIDTSTTDGKLLLSNRITNESIYLVDIIFTLIY